MDEGKDLRQAVDAVAGDALDEAMSLAFGSADNDARRPDVQTSEFVGRYKLLEQIGEGGFGVVYMAEQQAPMRRRVALKIIKLGMDTKEVVARFEAERQALAMMAHENIASVLDGGATDAGRPYFVMELVKGVPITEYCDRNKLTTRERLQLFVAVCRAIQHAHQKGIIHRDLKPSNVLVTLRDGVPVPKVIDFGVAKATQVRLTEKTIFTRFGQFIGTPAYMSPEQIEMSELDVDTRSDVYSLGVLLYELLTGSTPIHRDKLERASYSEMQRMICDQDPPTPSTRLSQSGDQLSTLSARRSTEPRKLNQLVRGELDWIVMKTLEKDRTRRYETANGLAEDVLAYLHDEPVTASPASASYRFRKFASKHRRWLGVGLAFTLVLLLSTIVSGWLTIQAMQAERRAIYQGDLAKQRLLREQRARQEVQTQRDRAEALGIELRKQLAKTDEEVERSRSLLYVAHMNLAQQELTQGNNPGLIELLNLHRPVDGQRDLRGFEWYYIWGLCHRHPWSWQYHTAVNSLAYSPDGATVVTGCSDGRVQVWNVLTGRALSAAGGHRKNVDDITFSPDGRLLATVSRDWTARLWRFDGNRLTPEGPVHKHDGWVVTAAFSPDGKHLALGGWELKLINLDTGAVQTLDNNGVFVYVAAISRDSRHLAWGGKSSKIEIRDLESGDVIRTLETGFRHVTAAAYSPSDDTLVVGGSLGGIELWKPTSGIRRLGNHAGPVNELVFSADGTTIASCGQDRQIMLWDADQGTQLDVLRGHSAEVHSVAFSPDKNSLVSGSADDTVKFWDLTRGQATIRLDAGTQPVGPIAFSPTHREAVVIGSEDGQVTLWNVARSAVIANLPPYPGVVRCLAFSPDGQTIVYGGGPLDEPAALQFWNIVTETASTTAKEHDQGVLAAAFSPTGDTLATAGDDGVLILWDVATAQPRIKIDDHSEAIVSLAFSPDGRRLATCSFRREAITIWNLDQLNEPPRTLEGHQSWVTTAAFSPDGTTLASGSVDNSVRIWDLETGKIRFTLRGHRLRVGCVMFSPDGATLASNSRDGQLKLWDTSTGQETTTLPCQPEMDGATLSFSSDGRMLATGQNHTVVVYRAPTDREFFYAEPAERPRNTQPRSKIADVRLPVVLRTGPFVHRHPGVSHRSSRWQVRSAAGSYTTPVVNQVTGVDTEDPSTLTIMAGVLLPDTTYVWRVATTGSNHQSTSFSEETSFTTTNFPLKVTPIDLTSQFNRDVIKNPGDDETDSLDASPGSHLAVEGFDGQQVDNPRVDGLPRNGRLGVHLLGDYAENNSIQTGYTDDSASPIYVAVPAGSYNQIRFLVVGGNGNSDMPVRFEYQDGTTQRAIIRCDDWFRDLDDGRFGILRSGLLPIINEMDRFYEHKFRDDDAAAIFEVIVDADPSKVMTSFVLEVDAEDAAYMDTALYPNHRRTRFNLLAATGLSFGQE